MIRKIALICYQKKEEYTEECFRYLERLYIPENVEVESLIVDHEESAYHAFQEGMESTNAEIKVYFSNDLFLTDQEILLKIYKLFEQDKEIDAIGMDGWKESCLDIICNERCNAVSSNLETTESVDISEKEYQEVEALNNYLLATRKDISWLSFYRKDYRYPLVLHSVALKKSGCKLVALLSKEQGYYQASSEAEIEELSEESFVQIKQFCFGESAFPSKRFYMPESGLVAVDDMKWALIMNGYDYVFSPKVVDFMGYSEQEKDEIVEELKRNHCNCAITRDFSRTLSRACFEMNIPYIAWSYDTPLQTLYREEAKLPTNYIFSFDKKMIDQVKEIDSSIRLYPVPLAVNMERNAGLVVSCEDEMKYACDISMVGSLYEKNYYQENCKKNCTKDVLNEIETTWIDLVYGRWNIPNAIHSYLSDECIKKIAEATEIDAKKSLHMENRFYEEVSIAKEITHRERVGALNVIAEKYPVVLYTNSKIEELRNVICKKGIDYYFETPKVFHLSKINLNITLRSIESGVIQRIYDIMAVGGFVLTNAQPEIEDYFEIGKDLVVFHDMKEMMEQIEYYLSHENDRMKIALNGYQKVRDQYNYPKVINDMLRVVFDQ